MPRPVCFLILVLLTAVPLCAQNMHLLYGFDQIPQTLLLNPGAHVEYDKHLGIPFLSNLYLDVGASHPDLNYNSVLLDADGGSDILRNIYAVDPDDGELFKVNQQVEILNAGIRLKDPRLYLSFGMYEQFKGFARYPKDLANLYFKGNDQNEDGVPELEDAFSISGLTFLGDLTGVFHLGLNMELTEDLIIGARLKLYSGSLSIESSSNRGKYFLTGGAPAYRHQFDGMDLAIRSSGFIKPDGSRDLGSPPEILSGLFFLQGNAGLGMDLGFTYFASDLVTVTGSVLDLGFLNYSNKVTGYEIKQDFEILDTSYFDPPAGREPRYWEDLWTGYYDDGKLDQVLDTLTSGYSHPRSVKLNASVEYDLGRRTSRSRSVYRNVSCDPDLTANRTAHAAGVQLFAEFQPGHPLWAVTAFYSREFTRQIHAKFTYTADEFSATNLGAGLSLHFGAFNFYATVDNLLALPVVKESNYQSFQIGMNLIY